ncbi:XRE family transcriptional regulator [Macrococcus hajekii]|uniref:XRE family transcriptional regulator n=1 Tax=Macrococcus hajekii TaxID=198482 RepID=A0A4R6BNI2_9STAP|nr:helix-turn-helix transcriptional regulator [Macrococcus hajekii]TDM03424.1 XRE family transcriptional regulator [Macrococcus hajekii]GGA98749.1 hypothetical protein GCM10007190_03440 [Macrococcus hajekii]
MEVDKKNLGNTIKNIRLKLGMTMEEFGKKINFANKSVVSKWEQGTSIPSAERLKIIADLSGLTVEELLYGEDKKLKDVGNTIYNDLLKFYPQNTHTGRALRYFNDEMRERFLLAGVKHILSESHVFNNCKTIDEFLIQYRSVKSLNEKTIYAFYTRSIVNLFIEAYVTEVKCNSNFIFSTLYKLNETINYFRSFQKSEHIESAEYNISDNQKIYFDTEKVTINPDLENEIHDILLQADHDLRLLMDKYPDEIYDQLLKVRYKNNLQNTINTNLKIYSKNNDFNRLNDYKFKSFIDKESQDLSQSINLLIKKNNGKGKVTKEEIEILLQDNLEIIRNNQK